MTQRPRSQPMAARARRDATKGLRLFVAVMFPEDVQAHLRKVCFQWRDAPELEGARFAREYHVTLKFLGDVNPGRLPAVSEALKPAYSAIRAFSVRIGDFGAFPKPGRASVLWQGVQEGADELRECARRTEAALTPLGFERESRPFVPHVTLARFGCAALTEWIPAENARRVAYPPFQVDAISLMESVPGLDGYLYRPRAVYALPQ